MSNRAISDLTVHHRLAALRRAGYKGPAYYLGRPAYAYRTRRTARALHPSAMARRAA